MDPGSITSVMVGLKVVGGLMAGDVARDFLKRVLAPVGDEVGKAIASPVREWNEARVRRAQEILTTAAMRLYEAGKQATPVPGRILFPLLQAAALEDDPELRRMWATMLANAADSARATDMMPAFASILAELTPIEAVVLEAVYLSKRDGDDVVTIGYSPDKPEEPLNWRMEIYVIHNKQRFRKVALPQNDYRVMYDNLARLGLIKDTFYGATRFGGSSSNRFYGPLELSPLGESFIAACAGLVH